MTDHTAQQDPQPQALTSAEIAARLVILECMTFHVASITEALVAKNMGVTLDGVRNDLSKLHQFMLDNLLQTDRETFEAGKTRVGQAVLSMFNLIERAMANLESIEQGTKEASLEALQEAESDPGHKKH
jgi:molybdenum-dependent DNA-binding transcriptional regulator ModE